MSARNEAGACGLVTSRDSAALRQSRPPRSHTTDASFRARLTSASPPFLDPAETPGTTIVLVLETNPEYWRVAGDLDVALRQVLIFVNAHLSLSKRNRVVLIAMHADGKCHYLYEPNDGLDAPGNAETLDPIQCDVGKKALAKLAALPASAIHETSATKKITATSRPRCPWRCATRTAKTSLSELLLLLRASYACRAPRTTRGSTYR